MPSLISATERANLVTDFDNIFDTFHRRIVVYKEPIKTPIAVDPANMVFGFGESQAEEGFTLTEVTGVFPAKIRYKTQDKILLHDLNVSVPDSTITIKVRRDCRDFINNGPTQKIEFDERVFLIDGFENRRSFLDSEFYVFKVKPVQ
jgi:hypothetical protein